VYVIYVTEKVTSMLRPITRLQPGSAAATAPPRTWTTPTATDRRYWLTRVSGVFLVTPMPALPDWAESGLPAPVAAALASLSPRAQQVAEAAFMGRVGQAKAELAELFGVSERTIAYDLAAIRAAVAAAYGRTLPRRTGNESRASYGYLAFATGTPDDVIDRGFSGTTELGTTSHVATAWSDLARAWVAQHRPDEVGSFEKLILTGPVPTGRAGRPLPSEDAVKTRAETIEFLRGWQTTWDGVLTDPGLAPLILG